MPEIIDGSSTAGAPDPPQIQTFLAKARMTLTSCRVATGLLQEGPPLVFVGVWRTKSLTRIDMFYNLLIYVYIYIYHYIYTIYVYIYIYITMDHRYIHHQVFIQLAWSHLWSQRPAGSRGRRPHHIWTLPPSGDRWCSTSIGPAKNLNGLDM